MTGTRNCLDCSYAGHMSASAEAVESNCSLSPSALLVLRALPHDWLAVTADFRIAAASTEHIGTAIASDGILTHRDMRKQVTQAFRRHVVEEADLEIESELVGGASRFIHVRATAISDDLVVLLIEDITKSVRIDAMRRDFIINVSHELKTPVGALMLLAEAVRSASNDQESIERFIERMQTEASRLGHLVNDLTDLSRLQSSDQQQNAASIPVKRIVTEAVDTVRLQAEQRAISIIVGEMEGLNVHGDEPQLVTALGNLIANAISYSPMSTQVAIAVREAETLIEISVTDQGSGIAEQDLERIFERFYRVDPARSRETGGTGLGLAIVKHICAAHGGECHVWSKQGEGSTFTLRLPAARRRVD